MRPIAPRSHVRTIAALLAACAAGTAAVVAVAPAASASPIIYPAALTDSFYASPGDLADHRPGDVLAARPVSAPAGFLNTDAVQLKFRSTNSEGHPIAAVTTVLSPRGAAPGRGVAVVSPASSMLWGSAVRPRPRCTPTIRSWRSAKPLA